MTSALQRYAEALGRLPVMPAFEQHRLAVRYARTRDPRIGQRLVLGNLRLVVKIARRLGGGQRADLMDLCRRGTPG